MPRVLITGAAGFIGMHTAIRFLKEGWDVGIDNLNDYYSVLKTRPSQSDICNLRRKKNSVFMKGI